MQAGLMRQRISIVSTPTSVDGLGQPVPGAGAPVIVLNTWARITAASSRDVYTRGAGRTGQVTHKITMRWTPAAITDGMTVQYGTRTFLIQDPPTDPDEMRRELDLLVLELSK